MVLDKLTIKDAFVLARYSTKGEPEKYGAHYVISCRIKILFLLTYINAEYSSDRNF